MGHSYLAPQHLHTTATRTQNNAQCKGRSKEEGSSQDCQASWSQEDHKDQGCTQEEGSQEDCCQEAQGCQAFRCQAQECTQEEDHEGRKEEVNFKQHLVHYPDG